MSEHFVEKLRAFIASQIPASQEVLVMDVHEEQPVFTDRDGKPVQQMTPYFFQELTFRLVVGHCPNYTTWSQGDEP